MPSRGGVARIQTGTREGRSFTASTSSSGGGALKEGTVGDGWGGMSSTTDLRRDLVNDGSEEG